MKKKKRKQRNGVEKIGERRQEDGKGEVPCDLLEREREREGGRNKRITKKLKKYNKKKSRIAIGQHHNFFLFSLANSQL